MAQHDYNIANQSGASFRQDLNNALSAAVTLNSGAASPSTTFAYQLWADTTAGVLKIRNAANNAWITLAELDGTLTMETGSAGSPGLYFRGDTNTGLFSGAADELAIATSGIQRLMIDSSGRVLLGPGAAGRAVGGAVVAQLGIETLGEAMSMVRNSADTSGAIIALGKSRATTAGGITAVQDLDILGELRFCGANGTDLTSIGAHIRAIVTGVVGSGGDLTDMPTSLAFSTTPDGEATAAEAMRIDPNKRLLVGTTAARTKFFNVDTYSPFVQFESANFENPGRFVSLVFGDNSFTGPVLVLGKHRSESVGAYTVAQSGDEAGQVSFQAADGTRFVECAQIRAEVDGTPGAADMPGRLIFSTTPDGTASLIPQIIIMSTGEVRFQNHIANAGNAGSCFRPVGASVDQLRMISASTGAATLQVFANNNGDIGSITTSGSATAYNTSSDYRLKENVIPVPDGITRLQQLKPSRFNFITDPDKTVDGFIAHEAQAIVPECVTGTKDAVDEDGNPVHQGIDQSKLVPLLTAALQEAIGKIETLEAKVAALEAA